ncbi:MAG TPA: OmpA family protein [Kofleriaceae bacterium]
MRASLVIGTMLLWSCSNPVVFQGQSTLPVTGTPPPVVAARPPPRVEVRDNKIEIHDKIQFDYDKATIKEASFGLMNEIAAVITKNPQIKRIRVEGHASSEGNPDHNRTLSNDRARSVVKYLDDHGVSAGELVAVGYGADRPIADNATEAGREQNRRVEFLILEEDVTHKKVQIDPQTGAEKVVEENHEVIRAPDADAGAQHAGKTPTKPTTTAHKKGS